MLLCDSGLIHVYLIETLGDFASNQACEQLVHIELIVLLKLSQVRQQLPVHADCSRKFKKVFRLEYRQDIILFEVDKRVNILHLHQVVIEHFLFLLVDVALRILNHRHRRIELLPDLIVNVFDSQLRWPLARYHRIVHLGFEAEIYLHFVIQVDTIDQLLVQ